MSTRTVFSTYAPPVWIRDTNCFAYNYDLTGAAVYVQGSLSYNKSAVLVSNRHVIFAAHTMGSPSTPFEIKFVNNSNTVFTYNVTGYRFVSGTDIMVGILDNVVDATLKIYKVLPSNFNSYYQTATDKEYNPLSTIFLGVNNAGYQKDCSVGDAQFQFPSLGVYVSYDEERKNAGRYVTAGNSGNPIFTTINDELVVLGLWYTGSDNTEGDTLVSGNRIGAFQTFNQYISDINVAMAILANTNYALTEIDLSNYKTYVDNKIPTIDTLATSYSRRPFISGRGIPSATITVYDSSTVLGTTTVSSLGEWSFTPLTDLSVGNHTFTAKSTLNGNISSTSNSVTVDIQIVPAPSISNPSSTYNPTPEISGTGTYVSGFTNNIYVYDSGEFIGYTSLLSAGTWTFTPSSVLSITSHTLTAKLVLGVDESTLSDTFTMTISKPSAPTVSFTSPTSDTTPTITGTALANSLILVYVDGVYAQPSVTSNGSGNYSWTPNVALSIGSHTIQAIQRPYFGNTSDKSTSQTIVIT